jgi:hypothetical protein
MSLATALGWYNRLLFDPSLRLKNDYSNGSGENNMIIQWVLEDPWWSSPVVDMWRVYSADIRTLCDGKTMSFRAMNMYLALIVRMSEGVVFVHCEAGVRVSEALWEGRRQDVWQWLCKAGIHAFFTSHANFIKSPVLTRQTIY